MELGTGPLSVIVISIQMRSKPEHNRTRPSEIFFAAIIKLCQLIFLDPTVMFESGARRPQRGFIIRSWIEKFN
jgi:hypothetical protein